MKSLESFKMDQNNNLIQNKEPNSEQIDIILDGLDYLSHISCYKATKLLSNKDQDPCRSYFSVKLPTLNVELTVNCHLFKCNWICITHATFTLYIERDFDELFKFVYNHNNRRHRINKLDTFQFIFYFQ